MFEKIYDRQLMQQWQQKWHGDAPFRAPLTTATRRWLAEALSEPEASDWLGEPLTTRLLAQLAPIEPFAWTDVQLDKHRTRAAIPAEHLRWLHELSECYANYKAVRVTLQDGTIHIVTSMTVEFSTNDYRWELIGLADGNWYIMPFDDIVAVEVEQTVRGTYEPLPRQTATLAIHYDEFHEERLFDNEKQRILYLFACFMKTVRTDEATNGWRFDIDYTVSEEEELIERILMAGHFVEVIAPTSLRARIVRELRALQEE